MAPNGPRLIGSSFLGGQPSLCVLESEEGAKRNGDLNNLLTFSYRGVLRS